MTRVPPLVFVLALGCDQVGDPIVYDLDGDQVLVGNDCDDHDATVFPGAEELCNGRDDDCDGTIDEELLIEAWVDTDQDGYGQKGSEPVLRCELDRGWADNKRDCDDVDAEVRPGVEEICDGRDQDCDDSIDEDLEQFRAWLDLDRDGYGRPDTLFEGCYVPAGYVDNDKDCDDGETTVHPDATEICNGVDEDCDGIEDNGLTVEGYVDGDGDTWGSPGSRQQVCPYDEGYIARGGDCDDGDPYVFPGSPEVCDGTDDNCDGVIDEGLAVTYYLDADQDGFGDARFDYAACLQPVGYVPDNTDCDDLHAATWPGNTEVCDELDNDCDTLVDEGIDTTWYADLDGDTLGDPWSRIETCWPPDSFVQLDGDCDDSDAAVPPSCPPTLFGGWPNVGGDWLRNNHAIGTVGTGTLTLAWEIDLGTALDPVAAGEGRVFASVGNAFSADMGLVALELETGALLWDRPVLPGAWISGPVWANPQVCAMVANGAASEVLCVDEETGADLFTDAVSAPASELMGPMEYFGKIYTGGGTTGGLFAHQLFSGTRLWFAALPNNPKWGASAWQGDVYVWDSSLYSYDALTGTLNYQHFLPFGTSSGPVAPVISEEGIGYIAGSTTLGAVDLTTRATLWSTVVTVNGFPALSDGRLYVVTNTGVAQEHDASNGALLRTFVPGTTLLGPPLVTDDALIVSSATNTYVYSLETGALLQTLATGGALTIAENHLMTAEANGFLHVYAW